MRIVVLLLFLSLNSAIVHADNMRALLLLRDSPDILFWSNMSNFAQAAANDLNIDLTVYFANYDDTAMLEKFREEARSDKKLDYVITMYAGEAANIIKEADELGIYTYIINAGVPDDERKIVEVPRQKYSHWLGEMIPDDVHSGYLVAKHLLLSAKKRGVPLTVLPVNGNTEHEVPIARYAGLVKASQEIKGTTILPQINTYWDKNLAKQKTIEHLQQNKEIGIVWTAADFLANAVTAGAKSINRKVLTGGIDWGNKEVEMVANGDIQLSVGGHFMDAAWALILLHDHHKGIDFADSFGISVKSDFFVLEPSTAKAYQDLFGQSNFDDIYFRRFSKFYNTGIDRYRFDLLNVMVQFLW